MKIIELQESILNEEIRMLGWKRVTESVFSCPACRTNLLIESIQFTDIVGKGIHAVCPMCNITQPIVEGNNVDGVWTRKAALTEAVDQYWAQGRTIDEIKRFLYEGAGLDATKVKLVLNDLGNLVMSFDSNVSADIVKSYI